MKPVCDKIDNKNFRMMIIKVTNRMCVTIYDERKSYNNRHVHWQSYLRHRFNDNNINSRNEKTNIK